MKNIQTWQKMQTQNEEIILVNSADEIIGTATKVDAHTNAGKLHRAFTIFLKNSDGKLLITQRGTKKPLWPLWWDAACSSHQWPNEDVIDASLRRLPFEIGCSATNLLVLGKYEYHAVYSPQWAENEINTILVGDIEGELQRNADEVADLYWATMEQIETQLTQPQYFAPWFAQAFALVQKHIKTL